MNAQIVDEQAEEESIMSEIKATLKNNPLKHSHINFDFAARLLHCQTKALFMEVLRS